ncbi:MAG: hypothetical protein RLY78_4412 [Pseudomonadota bacterium]
MVQAGRAAPRRGGPQHPLLVCQTGPGIGLGHLSRMRVAAQALTAAGLTPRLLVHGGADRRADDPPWTLLPTEAELVAAIDARLSDPVDGTSRPDALLLDLAAGALPAGLAPALDRWRRHGVPCIGIDGPATLHPHLDGIFMPSFRQPPWLDGTSGTVPVIWGWDCLLLPPLDAPPAVWQPPVRPEVLVLTGGSDATGLGAHWPTLLDATLPAGSRLHWVRGPWASAPCVPPGPTRCDWHWHDSPAGLGPLMQRCSHAVTVFGVSAFELLQHGVPTVVFSPYGDKDRSELAELAATGLLAVAADARTATARLATLLDDPVASARLARQARGHGVGGGGARLAGCLAALSFPTTNAAPAA